MRTVGDSTFAANFEPRKAAPLDARGVVQLMSDLVATSTWNKGDGNEYVYIGMPVVVTNDGTNNGLYVLLSTPYTSLSSWVKIGAQTADLSKKADLGTDGKVLVSQLPSYIDSVVEGTLATFPTTGVDNTIYVDTSTNKTYRWGGTIYVEIAASISLGETASTAYRGDRGKIAYDHSQLTSGNPHNVNKANIGLANVDNTSDLNKPISSATQVALDTKVPNSLKINGKSLTQNIEISVNDIADYAPEVVVSTSQPTNVYWKIWIKTI